MKTVETTTSRDLQDAEKFDQLQQTNEERFKKLEATLKILKESKVRNVVTARRDLDLIQVIFELVEKNVFYGVLSSKILLFSMVDCLV